ncbi:DUF899 domain-containing protein [Gilvimarinus algae]|uniref:DUF899 domain-containing protein n=1 Tax=Gilvimarinus algae TaxID=3058037 RepID=A0ABT8TAJ3_9GAMM|nr:DUF899 domain-containing protein [Gilvimarinus sp. SDUM040014]MDO3381140.1 DUF899 domain-containing protein [Gilvimarinus sp. SDUM040014]
MKNSVSEKEWQAAMEAFREKEKAFTRQRDALNAERRRLPVTPITKDYRFSGPQGEVGLVDLFADKKQLIVYHFMFARSPCNGCAMMVDNMGHPAHIRARDTSLVLISLAPLEKLEAFKQRMGWTLPWYSSADSDFNRDFGATRDNGEMFGLSVFIREGEDIYRSYFTSLRGVEYLGSNFSFLDLTPMGRQELWEDSPDTVPQTPPYQWWRFHDEYEEQ